MQTGARLLVAVVWVFAACQGNPSVSVDGGKDAAADAVADAVQRDSSQDAVSADGVRRDAPSSWDSQGWVVYDGGPVKVQDGGVVITEDGGAKIICYPTTCDGHLLKCGNCLDDDKDGKIDWRDPECLGPCDNTEGSALWAGVGGAVGTSCGVDCYFDYGNGPGNDNCVWDHQCDPLQPETPKCPYDQSLVGSQKCPAVQSAQCTSYCLPYTPNGCDCWGCCTFPQLAGKGPGGTDGYVWIGNFDDQKKVGTCTLADALDPQKCPPCTPVQGCFNPCGKCEVCVGKPLPPPECFAKPDGAILDAKVFDGGGVPPSQCPPSQQPCGLPGQPPCAPDEYCITGCCVKVRID